MKKILLVATILAILVAYRGYSAGISESDEQQLRREKYRELCLQDIRDNGAVFIGQIYKINPMEQFGSTTALGFEQPFNDGVAQAFIDCDPGLYGSWATWQNSSGDQIFVSQYSDPSILEAGPQTMLFEMVASPQRTVRIEIPGALNSKSEVWFNGQKAWWDGKVWRAQVYNPADVIGTEVDVIWTGHGGWHQLVSYGSFGETIIMDTTAIDTTMLSPTKVKAISFMVEGSYLQDDLIQCVGSYYDADRGCTVLQLISLFDDQIAEMTVILNGQDSPGRRANYFNKTFTNVGEVLEVPLGNTGIRPQSQIKVLLVNPTTGVYNWKWLNNQFIWWENNTTTETTPVKGG